MIDINATFFVQIIHFLFAWGVLRRFLFRPVVSVIQHEKASDTRLKNIIIAEQGLLEKAQKEQTRQWSWYQQQFKKRIPEVVLHTAISVRSFKKIEAPILSFAVQKQECSALTDLVVTRLSHD